MEHQRGPVLREYSHVMWHDTAAAMDYRSEYGSNLYIAMTIYNAALTDGGRYTVEELAKDWKLDARDAGLLQSTVKEAWAKGEWPDLRSGHDRRG